MSNYYCPDCNDTKLQSDKVARKVNEVIEQVNALIQVNNGTVDFIEDKANEIVQDIADVKVDIALGNVNTKLDKLNTSSKEITESINEVNSKINQANSRIDEANSSINEINSKINRDKSHLATGYETLPSGIILQWGESQINLDNVNTDITEVTFPKTFPGRAFTVFVTANSNGVINASAYVIQCYDIFQNKFTARATHSNFTATTGRVSFSWLAIGI